MITDIINFDITKPANFKIIAKQGDISSRFIEFHITNGDTILDLANKEIKCNFRKKDKTIFVANLSIYSTTNGVCTLELPYIILEDSYIATCELVITQSGKVLSTLPFEIEIVSSLMRDSVIVSSDEFEALTEALNKIDSYRVEMDSFNSQLEQMSINVKTFGAKGDGATDDREFLENCIEYLKDKGGTIKFPKGKYLLNSYSKDNSLKEKWGQILPLYSNIKFIFDDGAEIVVGDFFDNKKFILFNGFNSISEDSFSYIENISWYGGTISFGGSNSIMRTTPLKRVCIATGNCKNILVDNVTFKDGDLRNCIIAGDRKNNEYFTVRNCRFIDLVQNGVNDDFTAIYANMRYSHIYGCEFKNNNIKKGWEIACCVELHQSHSSWYDCSVYKYTRGCFLVSHIKETDKTEFLDVSKINGILNCELVNLWSDDNTHLLNIKIHDNNINARTREIEENYGVSALFTTSGGQNGATRFVKVYNNSLIVPSDERDYILSCVFGINNNSMNIRDVLIENNDFSVSQLCYTKGCENFIMDNFVIKNNTYNTATFVKYVFGLFTVKSLNNCYIEIELNKPVSIQMDYLLRFITSEQCTNNVLIIKPQNTDSITKPLLANENLLSSSKFSYPSNSNFIVTANTGIFPLYITSDNDYVKSATLLDKKNLPDAVVTLGKFVKSGSVLRTIVSISQDSNGTYPIRVLNENL